MPDCVACGAKTLKMMICRECLLERVNEFAGPEAREALIKTELFQEKFGGSTCTAECGYCGRCS